MGFIKWFKSFLYDSGVRIPNPLKGKKKQFNNKTAIVWGLRR